MNSHWTKPIGQSLPNLNVLVINGIEVGFIYKPKDSKTDKNMWRVHRGIGENNQFLVHMDTKAKAIKMLESVLGGNTITDQKI